MINGVMVSSTQRWILYVACLSRFLVWFIGYCSYHVAGLYDTSSDLLFVEPAVPVSFLDVVVKHAFSMFCNWDGLHFLHIANRKFGGDDIHDTPSDNVFVTLGYTGDKMHAFLPLYPVLIQRAADGIIYGTHWAGMTISTTNSLILGAMILNFVSFVAAATSLYALTYAVLKDDRLSIASAILFSFSPSSVFMTAVYTESVYACLAFFGLYLFVVSLTDVPTASSWLQACGSAVVLGLCACTRSNGSAFCIFFFHQLARLAWTFKRRLEYKIGLRKADISFVPRNIRSSSRRNDLGRTWLWGSSIQAVVAWVLDVAVESASASEAKWGKSDDRDTQGDAGSGFSDPTHAFLQQPPSFAMLVVASFPYALGVFLTVTPYGLYQRHIHTTYCSHVSTLSTSPPSVSAEWPSYCGGTFFSPYGAIQSRYWNVGFLSYYQLKQIPNFALAAPVLISAIAVLVHVGSFLFSTIFIRHAEKSLRRYVTRSAVATAAVHRELSLAQPLPKRSLLYSPRTAVFMLHLMAHVLVSLTILHIQVATRFLCACPPMYWALASVLIGHQEECRRTTEVPSTPSSSLPSPPSSAAASATTTTTTRFSFACSLPVLQLLIVAWCTLYFVVGTCLHATFLPWT